MAGLIPAPTRRVAVQRSRGPLAYRAALVFSLGAFLGGLYGALILAAVLVWRSG